MSDVSANDLLKIVGNLATPAAATTTRTASTGGFDFGGLSPTVVDAPQSEFDGGGGFWDAVKSVLPKALDVLDTPRAAVVSTIQESIDYSQGQGFDLGDWWDQTSDNIGFGDIIEENYADQGIWSKRALGLVGDVALDPLTYLGGASAVTRLGRTGLASKAFGMGDAALGQRILQKGISAASADDLARISQATGIAGLEKGVFFGVGKRQVKLTSRGSGQQAFDKIASKTRLFGSKLKISEVLAGKNAKAKQMMLFGTPDQASYAFNFVESTTTQASRFRTFEMDYDHRLGGVLEQVTNADPSVRVDLPLALGGDVDAVARVDSIAPGLFDQVAQFTETMPENANRWVGEDIFKFRENWHGLVTSDEMFDYAFKGASPGRFGKAGFEKQANLIPGGSFLGVELKDVGPGGSIPDQVRRIIEDHNAVFGEDSLQQLFNPDIVESLVARSHSYKRAVLARGVEQDLVRRGVAVRIPGSLEDIRLPTSVEDAVSTVAGKKALEDVRVRQLANQIRADRPQLLDEIATILDPEGVVATRRVQAASEEMGKVQAKLDALRKRRFELTEGRVTASGTRELVRVQKQIDDTLGDVAEAVADGGTPTTIGMDVGQVTVQRDRAAAAAAIDPSLAPEVERLTKLVDAGTAARRTGALPNVDAEDGKWFYGADNTGVGIPLVSSLDEGLTPTLKLSATVSNPKVFTSADELAQAVAGVDDLSARLLADGFDSVLVDEGNVRRAFALDSTQITAAGDQTLAPDWFTEIDDHVQQLRDLRRKSADAIGVEISKLSSDVDAHRLNLEALVEIAERNRLSIPEATSKRERLLRQTAERTLKQMDGVADAGARDSLHLSGLADVLGADVEAKLASGALTLPTADQALAGLQRKDIADSLDVLLKNGFQNLSDTTMGPDEIAELIKEATPIISDGAGAVKYLDKANKLFKTYAILTPGFHVRNFMGGTFNNMLAGVDVAAYGKFLPIHKRYVKAFNRGASTDEAIDLAVRGVRTADANAFRQTVEAGQVASAGRTIDTDAFFDELEPFVTSNAKKALKLTTENPLTKVGFRAGNRVEDSLRGVMAFDSFLKGDSASDAVARVAKYHFDYSDLSDFERNVARRVIPFYTWSRKNLPLQIEGLLSNPKAYVKFAHLKRNVELGVEEEETVPGYVEESLNIRTPWTTGQLRNIPGVGGLIGDADDRIYLMPDLPFRELTRSVDPGEVFGSTTPYLKTPLERKFGKKAFNNIPFRLDPQRVPETWEKFGLAQAMEAVGVAEKINGNYYATDKNIYTVEQLWSPLARTRRLLPSDDEAAFKDRQLTTLVNFAFGAGAFTNTERAINNELYSRELERRESQNYEDDLDEIRNGN